MPHYLVVAHQTATSALLISRLSELARDEPSARFAILVPATHPKHFVRREEGDRLFLWDPGEAYDAAEERGREARALFEESGLAVSRTIVGDDSPLLAIEDELRARPDRYDGIVISTLPPGISRWVRMDMLGQAQRRFDVAQLHVYEGNEDGDWVEGSASGEAGAAAARAPFFLGRLSGRRGLVAIAILAVVYLAAAAVLALAVDRDFFVNDVIALAVFAVFLIGLLLGERYAPARRVFGGERGRTPAASGDARTR